MTQPTKNHKLTSQQRQARKTLKSLRDSSPTEKAVFLTVNDERPPVSIPSEAVSYLEQILELMAQGHKVEIVSGATVMTTQQAADFLNVSRPHVVKLMETGVLPFTKVGKHRRIDLDDVIKYQKAQKHRARAALQNLADTAQELDMGY